MEPEVSFGIWLEKRRKALDLTREELSQRAGCSVSALRKIETDERRPSKQLAAILADCLDITLEDRSSFLKFARGEQLLERSLSPAPLPALQSQKAHIDWMAQTKFISPRLRDDIVPRPRLLDSLQAAISNHALTLVSAPAGYGKTTLLTLLASVSPKRSIAWISLDEDDNDPALFLAALIGAFQRSNLKFGTNLQIMLANLTNPANDARRVIGALINESLACLDETWVFLDDLHLVTEPVIFSALDYWLERMPPLMHLIIATRHDPPLVLARLRARGQLAEVRVSNLRFTADEARDFLNEKQCLGLSPDDLAKLQSRAEGWAAGLRLLAGSLGQMQSTSDRASFIQNLAETDRHVFSFLADEVLKRQEPETRTFLLETSILSELTAPLCAFVTGRDDAQQVLENYYRRNLFLVQADAVGRAYRYHTLFADFLRERLLLEKPERIAELHRRAGDALSKYAPSRAITHYLAAELWNQAAHTIEQVSEEFLRQGWFQTLKVWIEALPASVRDTRPRLLYLLGLSALQRGALNDAMNLLEPARLGFEKSGDQVGQGETLLLMVDTVSRQHDYAREAELTRQALGFPLPVHGQVQLLLAQVWQSLFQGDTKQAGVALDQALNLTLTSNDLRAVNVLAPILNAQLVFLPNGATRLHNYCREILSRFGNGVGVIQACTHSLQSYLFYQSGAVEEALREAEQARGMFNQVETLAYSDWQLRYVEGLLAELHGNPLAKEELWTRSLAQDEQNPSLQPYLIADLYCIGRAQWSQKKFDLARQTEARISGRIDPKEYPETLMARMLMRALIEITDRRFNEAERTLHSALAIEHRWCHAGLFGSPRTLLAYLHLQRKREQDAWSHFNTFLTECEEKNAPGLLLQETVIAIPLLRFAIERKFHVEFSRRLLDLLEAAGAPKPVPVPDTGETLSPREVEILKLIATGASNQAIAQQLIISEHTVKIHVSNILAKLRVSSRTQAVARARELRLV